MAEPLDLDVIEARADAATAGPWWWDEDEFMWRLHGVHGTISGNDWIPEQVLNHQIAKAPKQGTSYAEYWPERADADFIAAARTDVPALVAEVRRLRMALQVCEHTVHLVSPTEADVAAAQQASGAYCTDWSPEDVRDDLPDFEYREGS